MVQVDTTVLGLDAERAKTMPYIASMGIYVVSKEAMISLLRNDFPEANDFGSEVIPGATKLGMKVSSSFLHHYLVSSIHHAFATSRLFLTVPSARIQESAECSWQDQSRLLEDAIPHILVVADACCLVLGTSLLV